MSALPHLFSPVTLGALELPNRLVMPPMSVNFGVDEDGFLTEQHTAYLVERARHGTGMITIGGGAVHPSGLDLPRMPRIWDDCYIPALAELATAVKAHGSRVGMQLLHGGRQAFHAERVAPSPLPALGVVKGVPRELTPDDIAELVAAHAAAARRCQEAGCDFVEIHAAHGYLIAEFLAPLSNLRQDQYGGSFANRTRFLLEILAAIRETCDPDYPVGVRINGDDCIEGGWTLADCLRLVPLMEAAGADWLHISAGIYGSFPVTIPSMYQETACFTPLATAVREKATVPVIAVGRIKDPRQAEEIIAGGRADLVAMGRAHLADPALAAKARAGRFEEIRPCIGCCLGCIDRALALDEATCVMNPAVSREYLLGPAPEPAASPRRVLVVGAGPAGLAAARLAALRGHRVTIIDEAPAPGGLLHFARQAPGRGELGDLVEFYLGELTRLGVRLRLETPLDAALLDELDPGRVVLASGSATELPQVEGLWESGLEAHTVLDVLNGEALAGERALVLGGGVAGLTCADFLAERGLEVTVVNRDAHFAREISANDRTYLRERLKRPSVRLYKNAAITAVHDDGLSIRAGGQPVELRGFSDLVIAERRRPVRGGADLCRARGLEPVIIGDAKGPRSLLESQTEADEVGRTI